MPVSARFRFTLTKQTAHSGDDGEKNKAGNLFITIQYTGSVLDSLVSHPKDTGKDSPGISAYPRGGGPMAWGVLGDQKKVREMS